MSTPAVSLDRFRPARETLVWGGLLVNTELLVVLAYFWFVGGGFPSEPGYLLLVAVPWVWLNASLWALVRTDAPAASARRRLLAGALAAGYFLLLARVGGVLLPGIGERALGFRVVIYEIPPGFAPALLYSGSDVVVNLLPFRVVGYATLAYLVYVTVLDAAGSAAAGVLGLLSCVSCSLPVVAAVVSGVGGSAAFVATVTEGSYALSTAVFLLTVGLLQWRPDVADLAALRRAVNRR